MQTITRRTLTKWRREALQLVEKGPIEGTIDATLTFAHKSELSQRILRLTLILLDQELMKGK